ncbi:putrescine ABC transporter permease PotI [Klebsiella pneumoniae]|nr:putrescine ABC transporter permease PotI [Klebsiella pneumoniae]HBR5259867.1 putrescine ABC transporter permease PotI [Klebsiella pneumoniae]
MNDLPVVRSPWRILILVLGFTFLYAPMLMLVIYSFNSSKLVTVWAGWSTRWYSELFHDDAMMSAVGLSLTIAACAATAAAILGTIAAVVMVRFGRFRGSNGFAFMITAPLVMPDVITGLSLLLLFVALGHAIGWPSDRGMLTIWLAHVTFCTAYVAVVISSRLRELDHSIEEAAMDLGAAPLKVFFVITLPMIMPAVISGWLLAFTLSLDDLVIASFVSGPGATTLPMLVFLGSLALVFIEIWCAFSLVKGRNWARWIYLLTQIIAAGYLWAASLGYGYPELFSIPGESKREIFHSLVMQKLPDLLVLTLLFVPANCRRFFRLQ